MKQSNNKGTKAIHVTFLQSSSPLFMPVGCQCALIVNLAASAPITSLGHVSAVQHELYFTFLSSYSSVRR